MIEMEYLIQHRRQRSSIAYETAENGRGREGHPTMFGLDHVLKLIDIATYDSRSIHPERLNHPPVTSIHHPRDTSENTPSSFLQCNAPTQQKTAK